VSTLYDTKVNLNIIKRRRGYRVIPFTTRPFYVISQAFYRKF